MKRSDFLKNRGDNSPTLELTPQSMSNDGISRLTFTDQGGKEYNFRGKNFDNAMRAGLISENPDDDSSFVVAKELVFTINGWDGVRITDPKTPDEVK